MSIHACVGGWRRTARRASLPLLAPALILAGAFSGEAAHAANLEGDLDGDGVVGTSDEGWLKLLYGAQQGDLQYDLAADPNGDDRIDHKDLALFGVAFGATGGEVDSAPPEVFLTLNDIPDSQNDLLVVPPGGFHITVDLDSAGSSLVDIDNVSITSTQDLAGIPAGQELVSRFQLSRSRLFYAVPESETLAPTSHYLTVEVGDVAGNVASETYGFAVRDFAFGAPLGGSPQVVFLDFDQNRSGGPDIDLLEDLREYGLSSLQDPALEGIVRDRVVDVAVARARELYGRNADGSPGPDAVNLEFVTTAPGGEHARLCVGGESSLGSLFLGAAPLDPQNLVRAEDTCSGDVFGVFPAAMDNLWGGAPSYVEAFGPLDPDLGGTPVGEDPLDAVVLGQTVLDQEEIVRWFEIETGIQTLGMVLGNIIAHETGHLVGLVAHGAAPAGLFGGATGANTDHNVTSSGGTPSQTWLMNAGASFSFDEIAGRNGEAPPGFRPLAQAYLRNRVVLNQLVTALYPAPGLVAVTPNPVSYPGGQVTASITVDGVDLVGTPTVDLRGVGFPTWDSVQNVSLVSSTQLTGTINAFVVIPGFTYDVRVTNPDGQSAVLPAHLVVE